MKISKTQLRKMIRHELSEGFQTERVIDTTEYPDYVIRSLSYISKILMNMRSNTIAVVEDHDRDGIKYTVSVQGQSLMMDKQNGMGLMNMPEFSHMKHGEGYLHVTFRP